MKNIYNISGYTVADAKSEFNDKVSEMQSQFNDTASEMQSQFHDSVSEMQSQFHDSVSEMQSNINKSVQDFNKSLNESVQNMHTIPDLEVENEKANTGNFIDTPQGEAAEKVEVKIPEMTWATVEADTRAFEDVMNEQEVQGSTLEPVNKNDNIPKDSVSVGVGACILVGFLISAIILIAKVFGKSGKKSYAVTKYAADKQSRHEEKMWEMKKRARMQNELFQKQIQQAQNEEQRRIIEQQMLEFQRQMQRDMDTAQRIHEESMRQAQQDAQRQLDHQQQIHQNNMNQQMHNNFANQSSFNNFNNGF